MADPPRSPPLAVRLPEAARLLGVSPRLLQQLTAPRGPIPCARIGRAVVYRVADLEAWLANQARREGPR